MLCVMDAGEVDTLALDVQQVKDAGCFPTNQLNAVTVIIVVNSLPSDAFWHIVFLGLIQTQWHCYWGNV